MTVQELLYPMSLYVLYIFSFPLVNLVMRIKAVKEGGVDPKYYKTYSDKSLVSERLLLFERHTDNQFQVPIVFLVTCTVAISTQRVSMSLVYLAWLFVLSRVIHSYIHLGKNKVLKRAAAYAAGLSLILIMWVLILIN